MSVSEPFVIIGAGLAGAKAAEALRERGYDGPLVLVGEEEHRPYERPPLSKEFLSGKSEREKIFVHEESWYPEHDVELRLGRRAAAIDRGHRQVRLTDGSRIPYSKLLLATGSSPRHLPVLGANADRVLYLRTVDDSERLKSVLGQIERLVVIGAGWIGLEAAAAARGAGVDVTVVEEMELPLLRALGPEMAKVFADLHRRNGVNLRFGEEVAEIVTEGGYATGVRLRGGEVLPADAVLIGVGAVPNIQLAQDADLEVGSGVLVDAGLRTADPNIFAVGDIAEQQHPELGRRVRVEHWANALNQPATAAAGMLGEEAQYTKLPYFYTDQYDLGMEFTGLVEPGGYDSVVTRGAPESGQFIAFWLGGGRVLAGMPVNEWDLVEPINALITSGATVDPGALADPDVPLGSLAGGDAGAPAQESKDKDEG
jgi:3-phenylpropionate/trans-cinnamate dioxygenase ferredoxin reductase component